MNKNDNKPRAKKPPAAPKSAGKLPVVKLPPPDVGYIIMKGL